MRFLKTLFCLNLLLGILVPVGDVWGDAERVVRGSVIQVARETVYVNLGRTDGVAVTQVLQVLRDDREIGRLRIVRLADRFCACEVISQVDALRADDRVIGKVMFPEEAPEPSDTPGVVSESSAPKATGAQPPESFSDSRGKTRLRGKAALRYSLMNDGSDMNRDTHQSAAVVSLRAEQIGGAPLAFSFRMRARHYHVSGSRRTPIRHPGFRLYDMALTFDPEQGRYGFGFGRLNPGAIAGVGEFDGALLTARLGSGLQAGIFGGFQPDLVTSSFETQISKTGVFLNFNRERGLDFFQQGTLAFAGQYSNGAVEREFVYFQHAIRFGRHVYAYQQAELDLDRTDRSARMNKLQLTNAFLSFRYALSGIWSFGVGYDARKYLPLSFEDAMVDSLLDTAFRQGWRADIQVRPHQRILLYVRGNLSLREGARSARALMSGVTITRLPALGTTCRMRFTLVDGAYNRATDFGLGMGRNLGRSLHADVDWSHYRSHLLASDTRHTRDRISASLQVYLPKRSFLMVSHDLSLGTMDYAHTFVELGMRF